jgi:hypothetical protein
MERIVITYFDDEGNEHDEEFYVDEQVADHIHILENENAIMFGQTVKLNMQNDALKDMIEGYQVMVGNKHAGN